MRKEDASQEPLLIFNRLEVQAQFLFRLNSRLLILPVEIESPLLLSCMKRFFIYLWNNL